jgi:hypothetical protein
MYPMVLLGLRRHNGEMLGDRGHDTTEISEGNLHYNEE